MDLSKISGIKQIEDESLVKKMLRAMKFGSLLNSCGFNKRGNGGHSAYGLVYRIMVTLFLGKSLKVLWDSNNVVADCIKGESGKNCYYRILKKSQFNWRKLTQKISFTVIKTLMVLTNVKDTVLIIDDTPSHKRGKKTELLSLQYDHVTHKYFKGFTQMHLGWSDGNSFIPLDFCIKVGEKVLNGVNKILDRRVSGAKRRDESRMSKLEQSIAMLKRAYTLGVEAGYVVFDTWFAKPVFIKNVLEVGYHSVFHLPKNQKMWKLSYMGQNWSLKELYRLLISQKSFRKIQMGNITEDIASIIVKHHNGLDLKLVFCRLNNKTWMVYGSTDINQNDLDILKTYVKRWAIEPFFKEAKQLFKLGKEQSTDFDVQISMTSIRMIAYILTAYLKRLTQDERTIGDLFSTVANDFSKLNLDQDILDKIFKIVFDLLQIPSSVIQHIKPIFDYISENFTSRGTYHDLQFNQVF